jgi:mannose-6-phosphate isomerase-like protein (cupin superfamily)
VKEMKHEKLPSDRGTVLRKNTSQPLTISIDSEDLSGIFLINESEFLTEQISQKDLIIAPESHYMLINNTKQEITVNYDEDISDHFIVYDPYKYEDSEKQQIDPDEFEMTYEIQEGYIDILPKWYSIKFTYPDFNIIYIKPEMGISFQIHKERSEYWEILGGKPIVINDHKVFYYVERGTEFENPVGTYHSIINPNPKNGAFIILKEQWSGNFDEQDIKRIFNPNHYSDD